MRSSIGGFTTPRSPEKFGDRLFLTSGAVAIMRRGRRHSIAVLVVKMRHIEQALVAIEADKEYLPSPHHMEALSALRSNMKRIEADLSILESQLWERIKKWQDKPYTPIEKRRRKVLSFIGWWFAGFAGLDFTIMGWFTPLFAEPWHRLIASAVISLVLVLWINWSEKQFNN